MARRNTYALVMYGRLPEHDEVLLADRIWMTLRHVERGQRHDQIARFATIKEAADVRRELFPDYVSYIGIVTPGRLDKMLKGWKDDDTTARSERDDSGTENVAPAEPGRSTKRRGGARRSPAV